MPHDRLDSHWHLYGGRSYSAKNPLSASDLLRLAEGRPAKRTLKERYHALLCKLFGHHLVTDRWHRVDDGNWYAEKNYEIHIGCTRCRFVLVLDPKQTPESSER